MLADITWDPGGIYILLVEAGGNTSWRSKLVKIICVKATEPLLIILDDKQWQNKCQFLKSLVRKNSFFTIIKILMANSKYKVKFQYLKTRSALPFLPQSKNALL